MAFTVQQQTDIINKWNDYLGGRFTPIALQSWMTSNIVLSSDIATLTNTPQAQVDALILNPLSTGVNSTIGSPPGTIVPAGSALLSGSVTVQSDGSVLVGPGYAEIAVQSVNGGAAPADIVVDFDVVVVDGTVGYRADGQKIITGYLAGGVSVPNTITDGGIRIQCSTLSQPTFYQMKFLVSFLEQPVVGETINGNTVISLWEQHASADNINSPVSPVPSVSML